MTESIDQKVERLMAGFDRLAQAEQTLRSRGSLLYGDEYEVIKAPIHKMRLDLEAALRTALSTPAVQPVAPGWQWVPVEPTLEMQVFVHRQAWINAVSAALPTPPKEGV